MKICLRLRSFESKKLCNVGALRTAYKEAKNAVDKFNGLMVEMPVPKGKVGKKSSIPLNEPSVRDLWPERGPIREKASKR